MAVLPFDLDEEERLRQEQEAGGGAGNQIAGEPTGGTPGGGDEGGAPQGSPQSRGTSGWTDINAYLDSNKEQAVGTADKIAGRLNEEAVAFRGDFDKAKTSFQDKINQNRVDLDEDLTNRALADPTAFVQNDEDVAKFKKQRDAQYSGPTAFAESEDYGSLLQKVEEGKQKAAAVDTEAGREQLLASVMKNPTKGMTALDNLLIGGNKDARARLSEGAKPYAELNSYLDSITGDIASTVNQAKAGTEAARSATRTKLGEAKTNFGTDLTSRVGTARTDATAKKDALYAKLQSGEAFSPDEAAALGMSPEDYSNVQKIAKNLKIDYGQAFDLLPYFSAESADAIIQPENFASREDFLREQALQKLMDEDLPFLNDALIDQAGTAPTAAAKLNIGGAKDSVTNALKQRDEQLLGSFRQDDASRYDNTSPFYDGRFVDSVRRGINDPDYWQYLAQVAPKFSADGKQGLDGTLQAIRAGLRTGRFGGNRPFGLGPDYLSEDEVRRFNEFVEGRG